MPASCYQILDVGLCVESPHEQVLDRFHQDYQRFAVAQPPAGPRLNVRFEPGGASGPAFLEIDGVRDDLSGHADPALYATLTIAHRLMERVQDYTVLHAAVLGSEQGALALSGPPGSGKTTLAIALLEAGWSYLSDDFCPLHKETGLVHPFPRSLWVRPRPGAEASNLNQDKLLFPLDGKGIRIETGPRPLRWLFCLQGEQTAEVQLQRFRISLREGGEGPFLKDLEAIPGSAADRPEGPDSRTFLVSYPRLPGQTEQVRDLLARHRNAIWNVYTLQEQGPDFTRAPSLQPLGPIDAAWFLLRELKHAPTAGAMGSKPGALLAHLGSLLAGVSCFRLGPSPLKPRLGLIQAAVMG